MQSSLLNMYSYSKKCKRRLYKRIVTREELVRKCVCLPEKRGLAIFLLLHEFEKKQSLFSHAATYMTCIEQVKTSLKECVCQTRKNAFYFISKALFVLEKIKFLEFFVFEFHDVTECSIIK